MRAFPSGAFVVLSLLSLASRLPAALGQEPPPATAQQIEAVADRVIGNATHRFQIPGLILGIVQNGQVVLTKGYGVKKLGGNEVPDENTVFAIGSVSKALTAVGAMMLVDKGRIKLDDPISVYLHNLPRLWERITVRQYMTHTSGIPDFPKSGSFEEAVRRVATRPLLFPPGTQQRYTNANFAVIGQLIEAVSGQPYLKYMHDAVFAPLAMDSTGSYRQFLKKSDHATGYQGQAPNQHEADLNIAGYGIPSGGIASTLSDLLKLNAALLQQKLMGPATYKEMYTRTIPPGSETPWHFTPGWQARMAGKDEVIAKNGMVAGYACQWHFVPARDIAVIMIWNLSGKDDLWANTAQILWQGFGIPTQRREAELLRAMPEE